MNIVRLFPAIPYLINILSNTGKSGIQTSYKCFGTHQPNFKSTVLAILYSQQSAGNPTITASPLFYPFDLQPRKVMARNVFFSQKLKGFSKEEITVSVRAGWTRVAVRSPVHIPELETKLRSYNHKCL